VAAGAEQGALRKERKVARKRKRLHFLFTKMAPSTMEDLKPLTLADER
jgi:hypothetical protein